MTENEHEQEGAWIYSLAQGFPINFHLTSNQLLCTHSF